MSDPIPTSTLDKLLTAQLLVAWAGEAGEDPRLGWWNTDLANPLSAHDTYARMFPRTFLWATLQSVREAARREDARLRDRNHDPDQLVTLFRLGFELDERLDQRLVDLKQSGKSPTEALPGLTELLGPDWLVDEDDEDGPEWDPTAFTDWVDGHDTRSTQPALAGRRLTGAAPASPELTVAHLVGALTPLSDSYPLPHYRVIR